MDYGYRSPQGQIWSCDSLETAREIVTEAPHMEIVRREASGEWTVLDEIDDCTCIEYCDQDPKTACSLSGRPHVHPEIPGMPGVYGPCPIHPERPGDH